MDAAGAALLAASVRVAATGLEVRGSMKRAGCEGPFFADFDQDITRIGEQVTLGGRGLRNVSKRLKDDAEREREARIAAGTRHELGPRGG